MAPAPRRGGGEGEAVGVVDLARGQFLAGLDEFAAGGQHDHARARAHAHRAAADRGEQRDLRGGPRTVPASSARSPAFTSLPLARTCARASAGRYTCTCPSAPSGARAARPHAAHRAPRRARRRSTSTGTTASAPGGQRRPGHDARGLVRGRPGTGVGRAGRDVPDDLQDGRELLAGARHVRDPHRVPVHGAAVERRQGHRHRDVVDQDAALGVEQVQLDGFGGGGRSRGCPPDARPPTTGRPGRRGWSRRCSRLLHLLGYVTAEARSGTRAQVFTFARES